MRKQTARPAWAAGHDPAAHETQAAESISARADADVRTQRLALGWTQVELACEAGVGVRTLRYVERGSRRPTAEILAAIVGALRKRAAEQADPKRAA